METGEWMEKRLSNFERKIRLESQKKANAGKPKLVTEDVLETLDFVFSPIKPLDRIGDSGNLLLAKRKKDRREQYLIKHECCDCASNEFVYSKMARAMGYHMSESKLFNISDGEKRNYFKSGYTVGARYLSVVNAKPAYEIIRDRAVNWEEYHSFRALYLLFTESDTFETVLADDNCIYRVDTAGSFPISDFYLSRAGLDIEVEHVNVQESAKKKILRLMSGNFWPLNNFHSVMAERIEHYGEECRRGFLDPFYKIQEIPDTYIDDFLNTLCYFYPDFIGDYYKFFIDAAKKKAREFLEALV